MEPIYTVDRMAAIMEVAPETVRRWIRIGDLETINVGSTGATGKGRLYYIRLSDLEAFIDSRKAKAKTK